MPKRLLHLRPWSRHSSVLAGAGIVYIAYGASMSTLSSSGTRRDGLVLALNIMPLSGWGLVWITVGLLTLASTRWPPQSETWGYAALSGLAALWGALYLLGIPFRDGEWTASVPSVLMFFLVAFLWWGISGLMDPNDEQPHRPYFFDWTVYAPSHSKQYDPEE